MNIVGMMVVGPNEPMLKEVIRNLRRLEIEKIMVACNNADDATKQFLTKQKVLWYEDNREWGKFQPKIKSDLLKRLAHFNPDWVVACDADEIIDESCTRADLESLAQTGIAWNFYVVNLWNDHEHYARGLSFWNVRFFKFTPEYGLDFINKPVHCGLAPPMQYRYANDAPFILWHYGLVDKSIRQRKVERYKMYDPNHAYKSDLYYQALADPTPPAELDKNQLRARVREDVKNRKMKTVPANEDPKGYIYMQKGDRVIDVEAKDARRYERMGWKKKDDVQIQKETYFYADKQTVAPPVEDTNECPICGLVSKSLAGKKAHMRARHETA